MESADVVLMCDDLTALPFGREFHYVTCAFDSMNFLRFISFLREFLCFCRRLRHIRPHALF